MAHTELVTACRVGEAWRQYPSMSGQRRIIFSHAYLLRLSALQTQVKGSSYPGRVFLAARKTRLLTQGGSE